MGNGDGRGSDKGATAAERRARLRRQRDLARAHAEAVEAAALDAIVTVDSDQRIIAFNPAAERLFGYAARDAIGLPVTALMPERFRAAHLARVERFLAGSGPPRLLGGVGSGVCALRADGREFPMEASVSMSDTPAGVRLTAIIRDVGAQVDLIARLEERESQLRLAMESGGLGRAEVNLATGAFTAGDATAARLLGLGSDPARWTVPSLTDVIHPDDRERLAKIIDTIVREDHPLDAEVRVLWPDGSAHWIYGRGGLRRDRTGAPVAVYGVMMDIEERKRRAADHAGRLTAINKVQAVAEFDLEGRFLSANEIFQNVFGYALEELVGRHHSLLVDPAYRDSPEYANYWARLARGEHHAGQFRRVRKSGDEVWIQASYTPILDASGRPYKVVKYATDITRQKQQEAQMLELSRRVLVAQEDERRRIARELHDQIGQSLTAALINLQMLDTAGGPGPLHDVREVLDEVLRQVRELSLDLRPSMLDGLGLEAALKWYLERQGALGGFSAHVRCPAGRLPSATETLVFRLVQEATTNIVRHANARNVWVSVDNDDGDVILQVRDDGVGFDPAASLDRAVHGTSLGLISMTERAQLAGGAVTFDSAPGAGTTVTAVLPQAT